jgi:glycosyltransferase involved in cell wall biosynthesis
VQDALSMLFLADAYPWPLDNGAIQRSYHLLESFATRFRVTLLAQRRGGAAGAERTPLHDLGVRVLAVDNSDVLDRPEGPYGLWRPVGQQLRDLVAPGQPINVRRWWSNALLTRLRELYATGDHDFVWALRAPLAEMAQEAGWPPSRILVDLVDLESEAVGRALAPLGWYAKRPLHNLDLKRLERYEQTLPARFGHVVVCKAEDRAFLGGRANVSIVPNGVSPRPAVDLTHADANEMLFVGSMGYDPNVDAVTWFIRDIMPEIVRQHPPARLAIVGKESGPQVKALHNGRTCIVHGGVPDVTPFYAAAGLVVVPIRLGAGTRLKVLEALMLGKPIVATTMAIEGIDLRPGTHVEVADSADAFARACVALMRDEGRRRQLGEAGRQRAIELYQWSHIGELAAAAVARMQAAPVSSVVG